jgi:nitroimidazol reductase NimA-like FMN-containing flavoprotein (pyridoxamine 5'-phosphate oxidase superfamily)
MQIPVTTLDRRFSQPGAVATGWDETRRALEAAELFWISTVRGDGRPHVTPLVAVWFEEAIHFSTGVEEQKALNLSRNPHVVLTTGCNHWEDGLDVMVEGAAVRVTDDGTLRRLAEAWTTKWDGRWTYFVRDGCFHHDESEAVSQPIHVFSVVPTRVLAFTKGSFSHTSHRF